AEGLRAVFLDLKVPEERIDLLPAFVARIHAGLAAHRPAFETVFLSPWPRVLDALRELAPDRAACHDIEVPPGIVPEPTVYSGTRAAIERHNAYASVGRPLL